MQGSWSGTSVVIQCLRSLRGFHSRLGVELLRKNRLVMIIALEQGCRSQLKTQERFWTGIAAGLQADGLHGSLK